MKTTKNDKNSQAKTNYFALPGLTNAQTVESKIFQEVARAYCLSPDLLRTKTTRDHPYPEARFVTMTLLRKHHPNRTTNEIARIWKMNHSSVCHAAKQCREWREVDHKFDEKMRNLEADVLEAIK